MSGFITVFLIAGFGLWAIWQLEKLISYYTEEEE